MGYKLGIDVGGTFTDVVLTSEQGEVTLAKVRSRPQDPESVMREAVELLAKNKVMSVEELIGQVDIIIHGTTMATNALIQHNLAKTGMMCTKGFRDILQHREGYKEKRYDHFYPPPAELIPRHLRLPVEERITRSGQIYTPLNEDDVYRNIKMFKEQGVEAIVVCLLWSVANPVHERRIGEIVRKELPEVDVFLSSKVVPHVREYPRFSTTALCGCLGPLMRRYTDGMEGTLRSASFRNVVRYVQCNGGVASGAMLRQLPVLALNSGPAMSPVAALLFGQMFGYENMITADMGGTSFDCCLVSQGSIKVVKNVDVQRYRVSVPMVDVTTLGAGGGSIAWIDERGLLRVGPQSAEAFPGPACYNRGNEQPTVTDANVTLGYFSPSYLLGGRMPINGKLSGKAIREKIGHPLGISEEEAALAIFTIVNNNMANAMKRISTERGYDTRDFVLVAAGGCGSAHVGRLAEALEIPIVLIPKVASLLCAFGAVVSDVRHDYTTPYIAKFSELSCDKLNQCFKEMEKVALRDLAKEGVSEENTRLQRSVEIRYVGEIGELIVNIPTCEITKETLSEMAELFHEEHKRLYTFDDRSSTCELMNIGLTAYGLAKKWPIEAECLAVGDPSGAVRAKRKVFLSDIPTEVSIYDGGRIKSGNIVVGPAIVEEEDTTIVVLPRWQMELDGRGVYVMTIRD